MSRRKKTAPAKRNVHFVVIRHGDGAVDVYLEEPDLPARVYPRDTCLGRGVVPLTAEQVALLELMKQPATTESEMPDASVLTDLLAEAVLAGFQSSASSDKSAERPRSRKKAA